MNAVMIRQMEHAAKDVLLTLEILEALPWPAMALDEEGVITAVNSAMRQLRANSHHAVGHKLAERFAEYAAALHGGPPWAVPQEAEISREDEGRVVQERLLVRPFASATLVIIEDLTRVRELETTDARTERLASLGFMLAGACHEIGNPLTAIYSMLQLVQRSPQAQAPELQKALAHIGRDVQRLLEIAQRLSGFSRVDDASHAAFPVDESIEECLLLLRQSGQLDGIELVREADADSIADGNPGQLREVFHNIALNAIQAMDGRGRLEVRTSRTAGHVHVAFHDSGPGVPAKLLERIFEPFFTTKPQGKGTGLGLSISEEIVRRHRGRIRVENDPVRGAWFFVELPLASPRP